LLFHIWSIVGDAPAAAVPTFDQMGNARDAPDRPGGERQASERAGGEGAHEGQRPRKTTSISSTL